MRTSGAALSGARSMMRRSQRSQHSTPGWRSARPPPSWPRTPRRSTSTSRRRRWRRPASPLNGRLRGNETRLNNLTHNWYKDLWWFILTPVPFPPSGKCCLFRHICLPIFLPFPPVWVYDFQSCPSTALGDSQTFLIIMWLLLWLFYPFPIFISQDRFLMISEHHPCNTWVPHYLLLPQSNPSHVFNFLPLLCFLELILHLRWSRSYLKSTPTDTWHLALDKDHQRDNSRNYPWLFLSSFCTNTSYSY